MREHLAQQEALLEAKRHKTVKKVNKKWKDALTQRDEERKQLLDETKAERKGERKREWEDKKRRYADLVKHNEARVQEKQQQLEEISAEQKKYEKEERDKNKGKRQKLKEEHEEFLENEKEKLQKEMQTLVDERSELKKAKEEFAQKEKDVMDGVKSKVIKYFEKNKEKLKLDKKEKEGVAKFTKKKAVKEVLDKYDIPLRYFFDFYSKSEHHQIAFDLDKNMETMNYKEFIRFGYQSNIVPALLPVEEVTHTFRLLVRERQDSAGGKISVLDYDFFVKALVRIAALSQDYLGGQKGKRLEKRMEEIEKDKMKTQQMKKTLAKKFEKRNYQTDNESDHSLDRGGEASGNETERTDKTAKSTLELAQRGAKKPRKKIIYRGLKDTTLKNTSVLKDVMSEADILKRKSKNVNALIREGAKGQVFEHLKHVKVEDKRITRGVDVGLITEKTIEALLSYLQLLPEDNKYTLDKKLNKVVRYNAGAKPNRVVKRNVPSKAEVVDRDSSSGGEDDGSDHSPATARSKTETKTEKTEKTDKSEPDDSDGETTKK